MQTCIYKHEEVCVFLTTFINKRDYQSWFECVYSHYDRNVEVELEGLAAWGCYTLQY